MPPTRQPPVPTVYAQREPGLGATLVRRIPLWYGAGADRRQDRPAHVRAGSSLAWFGGRLAVVQDDASFIALIDPPDGRVEVLVLPAATGGIRQFDETRGNKGDKPDWEACATVPARQGESLWLFGSGSTPRRESIAIVHRSGRVEVFDGGGFYRSLRDEKAFSGSELNVEGTIYRDGCFRLFNRGNGACGDGLEAVNASCEVDAAALEAYLRRPGSAPPPPLEGIVSYDLGAIRGATLSFTDAAEAEAGIFYLAAAEASADAVSDGAVSGSAVGIIDAGGCRWVEIREIDGVATAMKMEGIALMPGRKDRLYAVVDADDPGRACELCEIALRGAW